MTAGKPTLCHANTIGAALANIAIQHPNGIRVEVTDAETGESIASLRTQTRAELAPTPAPRADGARVVPFKVAPTPKPSLEVVPDPVDDELDDEDDAGTPDDDGPVVAESGIEAPDLSIYTPAPRLGVPARFLPLTEHMRLATEGIGRGTGVIW